MVGEPHALPYITSGGQIDQGDDTIFASESGIRYHQYQYKYQYHQCEQIVGEGHQYFNPFLLFLGTTVVSEKS